MMGEAQIGYRSYLLRLWTGHQDNEPVWRVSLESVQTQQQWSFANLDDCSAFLKEQGKILSGADQNMDPQNEGDDPRLDGPL